MAWASSNGGGGADPSGAPMHRQAEMNPLIGVPRDASAEDESDAASRGSGALTPQTSHLSSPPPPPPPPMSGGIPSPASGIHTLRKDGVNRTIPANTSDAHHQLRHRAHHHHHQMPERAHSRSTPDRFQRGGQMGIQNSYSLDDADAAAGIRPMLASSLNRGSSSSSGPRSELRNGHGRSYSQPVNFHDGGGGSSPARPSRSLGNTPDKAYFTGAMQERANAILQALSPTSARKALDGGEQSSFFNAQMGQYFSNYHGAPRRQRMDRGIRGAYGSEHDFLLLSSFHDDDGSSASSTMSQGENIVSRRRGHQYSSPRRKGGELPSLPPLEITTSRSTSYPPYGLPSIEGSPSVVVDGEGRKRVLRLGPGADDGVPGPPMVPEEEPKSRFVVLGWDMSSYTRRSQFLISAGGTFGFSLLYGYLQELISVELCHRKLGLFLALAQFTGYTILSYFFRQLERGVNLSAVGSASSLNGNVGGPTPSMSLSRRLRRLRNWGKLRGKVSEQQGTPKADVPLELYVGLSILRAIDLGMTNLAMQYVNYPAKTLMKSTRVVFTMIFGIIVTKKRYGAADFGIVGLMVAGLAMFMHADAKSSAVFQPLGIIMLTISLLCDGAISNLSEALMNQYEVGQDEFIFRLYSIATFFICIAAAAKGDLRDGLVYLTTPGTLEEIEDGMDPTWSISGKILTMALFSTTGFLGSSCSAAITKSFGALTMSITSTARKATTIFLSFALFPNECTIEHIGGIFLFITSLVAKSLRASKRGSGGKHHHHHHPHHNHRDKHLLRGGAEAGNGGVALEASLRRKSFGEDAV